jgi:hypothetical protein
VQVTAVTEHSNAVVCGVSDDELVVGRARDAARRSEHADTDVADELATHAEHAQPVVAAVENGDVTVATHEAHCLWEAEVAIPDAV